MTPEDLRRAVGDIDIYLFDQIQKGRIRRGDRVLDAGCGSGRNLVFFLQAGIDVWAVDANPHAIEEVRELARRLAPGTAADRFVHTPIETMPWPDRHFTVVISSAVMHFARDHEQFGAMLTEMWRVLDRGGMLFARLASNIGLAEGLEPRSAGQFLLPDGTERYLATEAGLFDWADRLGGRLLDPIKTTVVQEQRSMTTWVLRKM